jgi:hypothetical protein
VTLVDPIRADCRGGYHAIRVSGLRDPAIIRWIVLHDTEGGTAEGVARYFTTSKAQGSVHLVVDDAECFRCLRNEEIPWGAVGANTKGFHIEQCGFAKWSAAIWQAHRQTLRRAAYKTAYHCHKFGIPPRFVDAAALKRGDKGVTTHKECSKAFGGDHSDPGLFWPRRLFMRYVTEYYQQLAGGYLTDEL